MLCEASSLHVVIPKTQKQSCVQMEEMVSIYC